jgi:hypothetical protein
MKIAVAMTRAVTGDISANVAGHLELASLAVAHGTQFLAFPELSLTGYEPTLAKALALDLEDPRLPPWRRSRGAPRSTSLAHERGVVAVALGGSRATVSADASSDWDLAVYYRGEIGTDALARYGEVHPPGSWGRIMNGGAWLEVGGRKVDVLLRDLDVALYWSERAVAGEYEVDGLLAYLAGVPTYSLLAERALGVTLCGDLPPVGPFPERLAARAPERWRYHRRFTLAQARSRAARGDVVGAVGQVARGIIEEAHAVLCGRHEWVLNEKHIIERAGLGAMHGLAGAAPRDRAELVKWVESIEVRLESR